MRRETIESIRRARHREEAATVRQRAYAVVMMVVAIAFAGAALFAVVRVIRAAWGP